MSLIGVFHRYTYIFHGYSGISVVFRYFGDSCDRDQISDSCDSYDLSQCWVSIKIIDTIYVSIQNDRFSIYHLVHYLHSGIILALDFCERKNPTWTKTVRDFQIQ